MLNTLLNVLIKPWKLWTKKEEIFLLFKNIFKYHNLSFNLNSEKYWDNHLSKFNRFWRNENYQHILDLLPKNGYFTLLDIGCAIGDGCQLLSEKFPNANISGCDYSTAAIKHAKNKDINVEFFVLDILKQAIRKNYDYITIIETLEHFEDPFTIVDKCLEHVNKALIISVPYEPCNEGKIKNISLHRYSFGDKTFRNYNCEIIKITKGIVKSTGNRCIIYKILANKNIASEKHSLNYAM